MFKKSYTHGVDNSTELKTIHERLYKSSGPYTNLISVPLSVRPHMSVENMQNMMKDAHKKIDRDVMVNGLGYQTLLRDQKHLAISKFWTITRHPTQEEMLEEYKGYYGGDQVLGPSVQEAGEEWKGFPIISFQFAEVYSSGPDGELKSQGIMEGPLMQAYFIGRTRPIQGFLGVHLEEYDSNRNIEDLIEVVNSLKPNEEIIKEEGHNLYEQFTGIHIISGKVAGEKLPNGPIFDSTYITFPEEEHTKNILAALNHFTHKSMKENFPYWMSNELIKHNENYKHILIDIENL